MWSNLVVTKMWKCSVLSVWERNNTEQVGPDRAKYANQIGAQYLLNNKHQSPPTLSWQSHLFLMQPFHFRFFIWLSLFHFILVILTLVMHASTTTANKDSLSEPAYDECLSRTSMCVKMAAATAASQLKPKETGSARQLAGPRPLFVKGFFCGWNNEKGDQRKEKHGVSIYSFPPQQIDLPQHEETGLRPKVPPAVAFSSPIYSWPTATSVSMTQICSPVVITLHSGWPVTVGQDRRGLLSRLARSHFLSRKEEGNEVLLPADVIFNPLPITSSDVRQHSTSY